MPFVIMVLFDVAGHDALDADAVASHDDRFLFPLLVEERRVHRIRILRSELEDVSEFHTGNDPERTGTVRTRFTCLRCPQVIVSIDRAVALADRCS